MSYVFYLIFILDAIKTSALDFSTFLEYLPLFLHDNVDEESE